MPHTHPIIWRRSCLEAFEGKEKRMKKKVKKRIFLIIFFFNKRQACCWFATSQRLQSSGAVLMCRTKICLFHSV
jgi:hypothetical protein